MNKTLLLGMCLLLGLLVFTGCAQEAMEENDAMEAIDDTQEVIDGSDSTAAEISDSEIVDDVVTDLIDENEEVDIGGMI